MQKQAYKSARKKSDCMISSELMLIFQGFVIQIIAFLITSLIALMLDIDSESFYIAACITLASGSFLSGFAISRKKRSNGLINGVVYSLPILAFPFISLFLNKFSVDFGFLISVIIILLFSASGGIVSVNIRKRSRIKK